MKVLVTGGAGFIGSALCRRLLQAEGAEVVVLDLLTYAGTLTSLAEVADAPGFRFVRGDIGDAAGVAELLERERPDAVAHLAAETHVDRSIAGAMPFVHTNVVGTAVLLEAALHHWRALPSAQAEAFRFLHVSTDEVFGSLAAAEGAFDEATAYDPSSPYSASKAAADHLVAAWGRTYGLPVVTANCSNNYGPRQFPEKLIPLTILNALEGRPVSVYGDGGQVRDWLHVDDHAHALALLLRRGRPGQRYLIGARGERTNLAVVEAVCDRLDALAPPLASGPRRGLIRFVADRPGHDRRYAIDPRKLEAELGWRPEHGFEAGLDATVRWYLARRDWWEPLRERYAGGRLGLAASGAERSA